MAESRLQKDGYEWIKIWNDMPSTALEKSCSTVTPAHWKSYVSMHAADSWAGTSCAWRSTLFNWVLINSKNRLYNIVVSLVDWSLFVVIIQEATVLRDGQKHTLNAEKLVMGDIIFVKFGDRIPADIRVIEARGFKVREVLRLIS